MERLVAFYGLDLAALRAGLPRAFYVAMRMAALSLDKEQLGERLSAAKALFEAAPAIAAWRQLVDLGMFTSITGGARAHAVRTLDRQTALATFEGIVDDVVKVVGRKRLTPEFQHHESTILDAVDALRSHASELAAILRTHGQLQIPLAHLVDQKVASNLSALANFVETTHWRALTEELSAKRAALDLGAAEYEARRQEFDQAANQSRDEAAVTSAAIAWFRRDPLALADVLDRLAKVRVDRHPAVARQPTNENIELWIDAHALQELFLMLVGDPLLDVVDLPGEFRTTGYLKMAPGWMES